MCRFDLSLEADEDNYFLVKVNIEELYNAALQQSLDTSLSLPDPPRGEVNRADLETQGL